MFALSITPLQKLQYTVLGYGLMFMSPFLPTTGIMALFTIVVFATAAVLLLRAAGAGFKPIEIKFSHPVQEGQSTKNHRLVLDTI